MFSTYLEFDLLRICAYSFPAFARSFLEESPGHFISPLRLSGSAIETLVQAQLTILLQEQHI